MQPGNESWRINTGNVSFIHIANAGGVGCVWVGWWGEGMVGCGCVMKGVWGVCGGYGVWVCGGLRVDRTKDL